jgi:hypothetical protein
MPATMSAVSRIAAEQEPASTRPKTWDASHSSRFVLSDALEHPFYWWPNTLMTYPIEFKEPVELNRLILTRVDTGESIPLQFSKVTKDQTRLQTATLNFFSDLPSGARREFVLSLGSPAPYKPQVSEHREGNTIVLDSGAVRVRIPATQLVRGNAPGPLMQFARADQWFGSSTLSIEGDHVARITTTPVEHGPLFLAYEISYETAGGSRYIAYVQCTAGLDFVHFQEDMEGLHSGVHGTILSNWSDFGVTHRQAPNHPFPVADNILPYDEYNWERIDDPWRSRDIQYGASIPPFPTIFPSGQVPFLLGNFQTWTAFHIATWVNFWNQHTNNAIGVFINRVEGWQDHEYAYEVESPTLQVSFFHQDGKFTWKWPLARGRRSTCVTFYDHEKDRQAMRRLEEATLLAEKDGYTYHVPLVPTSHVLFLQNRYGTLDLNRVKDWVLEYPGSGRRPPVIFATGSVKSSDDLEKQIITSDYIGSLPLVGTRQNGGHGFIPGRSIVNFSPVPSRQIQAWWVDAFNRLSAGMTDRQRKRLTAIYLFVSYVHAGEDFMPMVPMLSGHPNFLADVKGTPAAMAFLFPDHPMANTWADLWEKFVELNTRFNTRPAVKTWDAAGGRWTEDLGTYVWAFLRPALRTEYLLRQYDGRERFLSPQLAAMTDWLVNSLSAPFNGESEEAYRRTAAQDGGHDWGVLAPGKGPRRVHPPQGGHSERRVPPRSLWYLGNCLHRYAPLAAEHAMWAARSTNQDMETALGKPDAWDAMYRGVVDNRGTNPHLRSEKFTGYGIVLRAAVETPDEISIHLQQIDRGPNYRWGVAAEGGCGAIYFFAGGKSYSHNGAEDVGDRKDQDTDFCTNFGVYRNGGFRSIGENILSRPFYNLGTGQFAEIAAREGDHPYSSPEYLSRSILLAGSEYFIVYDALVDPTLIHRLSWFVRRGDELPTIKLVRGGSGDPRSTQRTDHQTDATTGVWFDGIGDSMAVVSHRKDIEATPTPFGCRVRTAGIQDLVFQNPAPVHFAEGSSAFSGTSGLIRTSKDRIDFAMFHGTHIEAAGVSFSTTDTDLGIGGSIVADKPASGDYFAPQPATIKITASFLSAKTIFYIDGSASTARRESGALVLDLEPGQHHWELTDTLPVSIEPHITRTEDRAGGTRIFLSPVASATQYRIELSKDNGLTWTTSATSPKPEIEIEGLANGQKVHVRAVALNTVHESASGPEYPVYITNQPPPAPDGLHVELAKGSASITWGEVLGAGEYRLYARTKEEKTFRLLYKGIARTYVDQHPDIHPCDGIPGLPFSTPKTTIFEYTVSAVSGNGEGLMSATANTDPTSWRNWTPKPGEAFRRVYSYPEGSQPQPDLQPRYYPE